MNRLFAVILAMVMMFVYGSAFACPPPCEVKVDGETVISALIEHGDAATGGFGFGESDGKFSAAGRKFVSGNTESEGKVYGASYEFPNLALSFSASSVRSDADAFGNCRASLEISGFAAEANWAKIGDNLNGAIGGNYTDGAYQGKQNHPGFISLGGGADAKGVTSLYSFSTPTSRESGGFTFGKSSAWLQQGKGDPSVSGFGNLSTRNSLDFGNLTAFAFGTGNASYSAKGPHFARGTLNIDGNTSIKFWANGIAVKSKIHSSASTNSH